jgi:hypothetical protein
MIQSLLRRWVADRDGERARVVCWFNAWEHDDAPHLGAALAANVARTANKRRRIWWRLVEPLPAAMLGPQERWRRALFMVFATVAAAALLVAFNATRELAENTLLPGETLIGGLGWLGVLWLGVLVWRAVFSAARDAARFIDDPRSEAARGSIAQVRDQLGKLIKQATRGGRMVIFVDDLERCRPARAVEIFEVASQLLGHSGIVTVLLADMRSLSAAAKAAYEGDVQSADADLGRRYLEKLVQLELELPPPTTEDMRRLLVGKQAHQVPKPAEQKAPPERPSWEAVQAGAFLAAIGSFAYVLTDFVLGGSGGGSTATAIDKVAPLAAVVGAIVGFIVSVWRLWARRQRHQIVQRLESNFDASSVEENGVAIGDEVLSKDGLGAEKLESFAGKEAESLKTVHSAEIRKVESFIQNYPPLFPRGAKRMLNHSRLLTKIARDRDMFGGASQLTPEHLGKWIVLKERWPRVAAAIVARHSAIEEEAQLHAISAAALDTTPVQLDTELRHLLSEVPALVGMIDRLIYFTPGEEAVAPVPPEAVQAGTTP